MLVTVLIIIKEEIDNVFSEFFSSFVFIFFSDHIPEDIPLAKTSPTAEQCCGKEEAEENDWFGAGSLALGPLFFHHGMNGMAGYLKSPSGHSHFPTHPSLGTSLTGMPMPALGPFGLPHALEPVAFPQGKSIRFISDAGTSRYLSLEYRETGSSNY